VNISTLCLGILALGEASGYEIRKRFEGPFRHMHEPSFGSIYPALAKLTRDGMVSCTVHSQEKRPSKKVYSITPAGRVALRQELESALPGPDRIRSDFLVTMLFSDILSPDFIDAAVAERIAFYNELGAVLQSNECGGNAGREFVRGYGMAVCRAAVEYLETVQRSTQDRETRTAA